jgi:protein-S-isoprenylcysteine O-methyltransferase Ste14
VIPDDRYLLVRAASLYVTVVLTVMVWAWRRPNSRLLSGAILAAFWNLPIVLLLQVSAVRFGWWQFDAQGGLLFGMPVELYLSWVWLWSVVPALAFPSASIGVVLVVVLTFDVIVLPAASPVLRLGPAWLAGEAIGLLMGVVPGQLLARWTARNQHLEARAMLQVVAFSGLLMLVLPAVAIVGSGSGWHNPLDRPVWQISLIAHILGIPAIVGLTAVQEFVTRGQGTPVPFDPPSRLVTTGVYAYVRSPMQLSAIVLLLLLGVVVRDLWVSAAGIMAHLYSVGLAGWDENDDLRARFGERWTTYQKAVRRWVPRLRPWRQPDLPAAQLFVAASCEMCGEVGRWFERRGARHLAIVAAETHPSGSLMRMTYEPGDGSRASSGVEAAARALEHVHLGWALIGFALRLPVVLQFAQILVDASGGQPRRIESAIPARACAPQPQSTSEARRDR